MGCILRTQRTAKKSKTAFSCLTVSGRFGVMLKLSWLCCKKKQRTMAVSLGITIFSVKEKITHIKSKKLNKGPVI